MQRDVPFESDTHAQVVHLPASGGLSANHIEIDDARFLFTAHFKKSGPDLILTGDDGRKLVVVDYFNTATPPDLTSHGATLSGDLVAHLAGPDARVTMPRPGRRPVPRLSANASGWAAAPACSMPTGWSRT